MIRGFYTYIVRCCDGSLYAGWTVDPERRVRQHNAGRGARYTRSHRPVELVYCQAHASRAEAMRYEKTIKNMTHARKLALVEQSGISGSSDSE